jgi:threonine/homoserine/homoserine lactone efflux protein
MDMPLLPALALFALVTSVTPGPNNLMLLASGANFGYRRSLRHMLGIGIGHGVMILILGLGLIELLNRAPAMMPLLRFAALAYIGWLAWQIARSGPPGSATRARPFGFFQAAAFQWVNPKGWAMALGALGAYAPGGDLPSVLTVVAVFAAVNFPSISLWTLGGTVIARLLRDPRHLRAFNLLMAALLVLAMLPVLVAEFSP